MAWSYDEKKTLERLWGEGKTANECAKALPGKSRNAILGQAHRLGLMKRGNPVESVEVRFERVIDLVTYADHTVEAAARAVGMRQDTALRMWEELCNAPGFMNK